MKKISVIIVYTNPDQLKKAEHWLLQQSIAPQLQLIFLDNRENAFSSAAKALNYGARQATGEILVFMHQDVYLWDIHSLETYYNYLIKNPTAIIGAAGVPAGKGTTMDLYETEARICRGNRANGMIQTVDALDECILAMHKDTWSALGFDEVCCDNWHGYGMDICMSNRLRGGENVLVPLKICHDSLGSPHTKSYRATIKNLVRKYRGTAIKEIHGCCILLPCRWSSYYWYCCKQNLKERLQHLKKGTK